MTSSNYYLVPDQNQNLPVKKPKRRRRRGWSSAAFGLLLAVSGLALARLGHLWIGLDIFSQLFMHFVFLGLAVLLGMAVPRFKGLAS